MVNKQRNSLSQQTRYSGRDDGSVGQIPLEMRTYCETGYLVVGLYNCLIAMIDGRISLKKNELEYSA